MKSIVIYFSKTGQNYVGGSIQNLTKGNTEIVAEYIRDIVDADLFKVEPVNPYPDDYYECIEVAKQEMRDNVRPELKNWPNTDLSEYDTVFIGGPIYWGTYPVSMFSLLEKYNWSNKTIMPFSTHEGSGLGDIMRDIKRLCAGADVKSGLAITGGSVKDSKSSVETWIKKNEIA